jgi:hypothetical protein
MSALLCVWCSLCWRVQGAWECPALYPVLCDWRVQGGWGYTALRPVLSMLESLRCTCVRIAPIPAEQRQWAGLLGQMTWRKMVRWHAYLLASKGLREVWGFFKLQTVRRCVCVCEWWRKLQRRRICMYWEDLALRWWEEQFTKHTI